MFDKCEGSGPMNYLQHCLVLVYNFPAARLGLQCLVFDEADQLLEMWAGGRVRGRVREVRSG